MELILNAAGRLLGTELSDPVDLGGSSRSVVLRCRTAAGGSVIVKSYTGEPGLRSFTSEAAGLSLGLAGPELLGVDADVPLIVMADLGDAPTLADVLLGDDPRAAIDGLLSWAGGLGRLAAGSVARRDELDRLQAGYARGPAPWGNEPWQERNAGRLLTLLTDAGVAFPGALAAELAEIGTAGGADYPAFTPGDTCPDNNLLTPDGLRLLDFESACFQSVFLTAAYCRMPFSSCWCVFRLPDGIAGRIEQAYRAEVVAVYPALADDAVWDEGLRRASIVWTVDATVHLLARGDGDVHLHPTRRPAPTGHQLLRYRWETAAGVEGFPAFAETMRLLLDTFLDEWRMPGLPGYPAFAGRG